MMMRCEGCGKEYTVTADYAATYAGQSATCECGRAMTVPSPPPTEILCGWQSEGLVVAERGKKLPRRCLKCGVAIKSQMKPIVLEWKGGDPTVRSIALGWARSNLMPVDVVGIVDTAMANVEMQAIVVRIGYCPAHRPRLNKWGMAGGLLLLGIAFLVLLISSIDGGGWLAAAAGIGMIISLVASIAVLRAGPPVRVVDFVGNRAWIKGFGEAYVASLPLFSDALMLDAEAARIA